MLLAELRFDTRRGLTATPHARLWPAPPALDRFNPITLPLHQMNGYRTRSTDNVLRQRTYNVGQHVRWGHRFVPIVRPPGFSGWVGS